MLDTCLEIMQQRIISSNQIYNHAGNLEKYLAHPAYQKHFDNAFQAFNKEIGDTEDLTQSK